MRNNNAIKMIKRISVISFITVLCFQCQTQTIHSNEIALSLSKLERKGEISQSNKKDDFFRFLDPIISSFDSLGYGHRINEITETWNLYEDQNYLIMTGSVAKTDDEIYIFTIVYNDRKNGNFKIVYEEIGNDKSGKYPEDIIPFNY